MGICRRPSGCVVGDGRFREKRQPGFRKKNAIQGKIRGAGSGNTKRWFREKNWRFRETRGTRFREISKAGFREKNRTFNEIQVSLTNTSYEREASLNHGGKAWLVGGPKPIQLARSQGRQLARLQGRQLGPPCNIFKNLKGRWIWVAFWSTSWRHAVWSLLCVLGKLQALTKKLQEREISIASFFSLIL